MVWYHCIIVGRFSGLIALHRCVRAAFPTVLTAVFQLYQYMVPRLFIFT